MQFAGNGVRECNFQGVSNEFSSKDALCRTKIKSYTFFKQRISLNLKHIVQISFDGLSGKRQIMIIATSMDIRSSLFRYYVIHFPRISSLDDVISNDMAFPSTTQVLGYTWMQHSLCDSHADCDWIQNFIFSFIYLYFFFLHKNILITLFASYRSILISQ